MNRKQIITLLAFSILTSCSEPSTYNTCASCDSLLHLIVLSADIDTGLKKRDVIEDGDANDTVLVKIYHRNEVEPGAFFDAADGFLLLDLVALKAYLGTIEPDSNIEVNVNKELIKCYRDNCKQ